MLQCFFFSENVLGVLENLEHLQGFLKTFTFNGNNLGMGWGEVFPKGVGKIFWLGFRFLGFKIKLLFCYTLVMKYSGLFKEFKSLVPTQIKSNEVFRSLSQLQES